MASSYLQMPAPPPSSPPLAKLSHVRSFGTSLVPAELVAAAGSRRRRWLLHLHLFLSLLDLLDQLAGSTSDLEGYESESNPNGPTILEQLAHLVRDREGNFSIPLGKNLKKVSEKFLTVSQKGNIKRQAYMDEVSQRSDSVFFATIGAFVILPPFVILGIAVLTSYVQLFP